MGKYINISKYLEKDNKYYYYVLGDYSPPFYIALEPEKNLVLFYQDNDFSKQPLGVIDFNQEKPLKSISGLHRIDVNTAAMQAGLAMYRNNFPDFIGFSS